MLVIDNHEFSVTSYSEVDNQNTYCRQRKLGQLNTEQVGLDLYPVTPENNLVFKM